MCILSFSATLVRTAMGRHSALMSLYVVLSGLQLAAAIPYAVPQRVPTPAYPTPALQQHLQSSGFIFGGGNSHRQISGRGIDMPCGTGMVLPIVNRSVPCEQNDMARIELSDGQLKQLLADEGGSFITEYMATNHNEAQANFHNLLPSQSSYRKVNQHLGSSYEMKSFPLTKHQIIALLQSNITPSPTETMQPEVTSREATTKGPEHITPEQHGLLSGALNLTTKSQYQNNSPHRKWKDVKMTLPLHVLTKLIQEEYTFPVETRIKRDVTGGTTTPDYCEKAGKSTPDGYLHLCSHCSHTTTLPADKFPRILNEVHCNAQSTGCLFTGNSAHGACRQRSFGVTMLRKKANSCMTVVKDGVHYVTDEWEKYFQIIKLGCECVVNKVSPFSKYVVPKA